MKHSPSITHPVLKLIKKLERVQITTPESTLHGEAALRLTEIYDRNTALVAALREARDFIEAVMDSGDPASLLINSGEDVTARLNDALHLDAFDIGDNVLAESANLDLSEYQGLIVGKREDRDGTPLFAVEDQEGNCRDHSAEEIRLTY